MKRTYPANPTTALVRQRLLIGLLASGAIAATLSSCGSGKSEKDLVGPIGPQTDWAERSCRYQFNEGSAVAESLPPEPVTVMFDKPIDRSKLMAVATASAKATVDYIRQNGAEVGLAAGTEGDPATGACNFFAPLANAPTDVQIYWKKAVASIKEGTLLGVYVHKNYPSLPSTDSVARITVRQDANRSVLVHEYTHHLFEIAARETDGTSSEILNIAREKLQAMEDAVDAVSSTPTKETVQSALKAVEDAWMPTRRALVRFFLEEVTIETILQKAVEDGKMQYFPHSLESSNWYISSSAQKALDVMDDINKKYSDMAKRAFVFGISSDLSKEVSDDMSFLYSSANRIKSVADRQLRKRFFNAPHEEPECAHNKAADEVFGRILRNRKNTDERSTSTGG